MTPADYAKARRLLLRADPVIASLIAQHGACGLAAAQRGDHFSALVRAITNQQLSTKAAATIYRRLTELMPGGTPTPEGFAAVSDEQLRAVGYSRQKIGYLRDLVRHVHEHQLDLEVIETLADEEVVTQLTQIKGIGRWSAEIYLLFAEGRADVFPAGDLAVMIELGRLMGLEEKPSEKQLRELAEAWRPYRGAAAVLAWHSYNSSVL